LNSSVYLPRTCPSFLLLIFDSPIDEFDHQLWSPFFGGKVTLLTIGQPKPDTKATS